MAKITAAVFLLQAPSVRSKVYGSVAWLDPSTGLAHMASAYGSESQLRGGSLHVLDDHAASKKALGKTPVGHTVNDVASGFADRYEWKSNASRFESGKPDYNVVLGGPCHVTVDEDALTPDALRSFFRDHVQGRSAAASTPAVLALDALGGGTTATTVTPPPAAAAKPTVKASKHTGIAMADGSTYYPRMVAGMLDVDVMRQARSMKIGVGLLGSTGAGKSTLALAAFAGERVITFNCSEASRAEDLVGKWSPAQPGDNTTAEYVYRPGPLTIAMTEGLPCVIEELTRATTEIVDVLLSATDFTRTIYPPALPGERVTAADGFTVIGTWNVRGTGVRELDPAILRRFAVKIEVSNDYDAAARRGVNAKLIKVAKNLATKDQVALANGEFGNWTPPVASLLDAQKLLDAGMGEEFALGALMANVPEEDADTVSDVFSTVFGFTPKPLALGMSI